jgi:hypothetical protein
LKTILGKLRYSAFTQAEDRMVTKGLFQALLLLGLYAGCVFAGVWAHDHAEAVQDFLLAVHRLIP